MHTVHQNLGWMSMGTCWAGLILVPDLCDWCSHQMKLTPIELTPVFDRHLGVKIFHLNIDQATVACTHIKTTCYRPANIPVEIQLQPILCCFFFKAHHVCLASNASSVKCQGFDEGSVTPQHESATPPTWSAGGGAQDAGGVAMTVLLCACAHCTAEKPVHWSTVQRHCTVWEGRSRHTSAGMHAVYWASSVRGTWGKGNKKKGGWPQRIAAFCDVWLR